MASFKFDGIDTISFEQAAQMTDEDKLSVIMPAANLLKERHAEAIRQTFAQHSGDLAESIGISVKAGESGSSAFVSPQGTHSRTNKGLRKRKKTGTKRKYRNSNAEIAFILEYGSPRIAARHWMENANEKAEPEVAEAMETAFGDVLRKKGLI